MIIPLGIKCKYTCQVKEKILEKRLRGFGIINLKGESPIKFKGLINLELGFMEGFRIRRTITPPEEGSKKVLTLDWVFTLPTLEWAMLKQIDSGVITYNCHLFTSDDNYESKMWKYGRDGKACSSQEEEIKVDDEVE